MPPPSEAPALNSDGTLKDAADMEWDYSPTQPSLTIKLPARAMPSSPTPSRPSCAIAASAFKIISSTPADFTNPRKHKAVNYVPGQAKDVGPALTCSNEPDGTNTKAKKASVPAAITRVLQNGSKLLRDESSTSIEDDNGDDTTSEPSKKRHKRGSGAADILTIFKLVDANDPSQGYICMPCV